MQTLWRKRSFLSCSQPIRQHSSLCLKTINWHIHSMEFYQIVGGYLEINEKEGVKWENRSYQKFFGLYKWILEIDIILVVFQPYIPSTKKSELSSNFLLSRLVTLSGYEGKICLCRGVYERLYGFTMTTLKEKKNKILCLLVSRL